MRNNVENPFAATAPLASVELNRIEKLTFIRTIVLLQIALSALLSYAVLPCFSTLESNGRWIATKTTLERGLVGSRDFVNGTQALSRNRLNLGVWHGHQEVIYGEKINPREIDFNFCLTPNSYLYCVFNKDAEKFSAIRLSVNKDFPSAYITALDNGKFETKTPLPLDSVQPGEWRSFRIVFEPAGFSLHLDGKQIAAFSSTIIHDQRLGFRGGKESAFVDDILVRGDDSRALLKESFWNRPMFFQLLFRFLVAIAVLDILFFSLRWMCKIPLRKAFFVVLAFTLCTMALSFPLGVFAAVEAGRYPHIDGCYNRITSTRDYVWLMDSMEILRKELEQRYSKDSATHPVRILFIGSSQTWGAGAKTEKETYVRRLESLLNEHGGETRYECVNTGIQGTFAPFLFGAYERNWVRLDPKITVIDLSSNDDWEPDEFYRAMKRFAEFNKARGIKTIFLLEPNCSENTPGELVTHAKMRQVGKEEGVLTLDIHAYLKGRRDDGILWWDNVHPTSYGHELIAQFLADRLQEVIGNSKTRRHP